ncbi:YwpF-like family protein [Bacillus sp. 31A1R]|uniref:YwpF-like family protein n=1 Tax=Robertmurraya mangrovi TaxID=3098077 RepID=A0ABU5IXM0_9BACI|nr:YwpF-like family protein [Bacillus sp. 31A1R]MDZ5471850.1 YwpF-like family protein [Bacillus sp. 31A1R]
MKTFKLVSLQIQEEDHLKDIPLDDGLIINREDDTSNWLIEAYVSKTFFDFFQNAMGNANELTTQVVISKKENDPAFFKTKVKSVRIFEKHISVLLEGKLKKMKSDYAELLLNDLIQKGFAGDTLITEFKTQMINRPRIQSK